MSPAGTAASAEGQALCQPGWFVTVPCAPRAHCLWGLCLPCTSLWLHSPESGRNAAELYPAGTRRHWAGKARGIKLSQVDNSLKCQPPQTAHCTPYSCVLGSTLSCSLTLPGVRAREGNVPCKNTFRMLEIIKLHIYAG